MHVPICLKRGGAAIVASFLLVGTAFAATDASKVTSTTEGVTFGTDKQYAEPAATSEYATLQNAAGCVGMLILLGAIPFAINRAGKNSKRKEADEQAYMKKAHREAVHRIIDTKQHYRAYVERDLQHGYNLVVVSKTCQWTGNFPEEEDALRFAYENGIDID